MFSWRCVDVLHGDIPTLSAAIKGWHSHCSRSGEHFDVLRDHVSNWPCGPQKLKAEATLAERWPRNFDNKLAAAVNFLSRTSKDGWETIIDFTQAHWGKEAAENVTIEVVSPVFDPQHRSLARSSHCWARTGSHMCWLILAKACTEILHCVTFHPLKLPYREKFTSEKFTSF